MNTQFGKFTVAVATLLLLSCASGKMIEKVPTDNTVGITEGVHRLFLVGDAGEVNSIQADNLALLRKQLMASDLPSTVVYLGDNVYPRGIPNRNDTSEYSGAVQIIQKQIEAVDGLADQTIFIPGNHDWNKGKKGGLMAIRNQDKLIKELGGENVRMLPRKGCPGPEVIELTKDVVLIILDSQWWLQDWSTEEDINDDCDIMSRGEFIAAFSELLKDYQEQQVIVAMHHPLVSAGSHGGYFTFRDHMFPLTNLHSLRGFYFPLPIIGSIYPVYRSNFGNVQDIVHHKYSALSNGLRQAAQHHKNVIFVSGHEHSLEYHTLDNHHFIVSGGGSRTSDIGKPKTLKFGHGAPGFVQLNLKTGGAVDLVVWESGEGAPVDPVYRTSVTTGVARTSTSTQYADPSTMPERISMPISTKYVKGGVHRFFFGKRYRDIYDIPVEVPVIDLKEVHGGLTPIKKGGGMQTNSLRLLSPEDKEYAARAMNKDASKLLPESLKNTFASDILQDQFTASHPYAAFVIPELASKAHVYHTNPELVYIPKQQALGVYAEEFGDQLFLLEERPSGDWSGYANFGNSEDIVSYGDVVEETMNDYRNQVDQEAVVRARLFDFFLGDWDRHDDQWRWASFKRTDGDGRLYQPIPRDRDQAFANYDGLVVSLARLFNPTVRKLGRFGDDIDNVKWFNDNGKWFDRDFLNALTEEQFVRIANELKTVLTDALIEQSIRQLTPEVFAEGGAEIISHLKARRDLLPEYALRYYQNLSEIVHVRGTNNADYFEIVREPAQTTIRVYDSNKSGDKKQQYYNRVFSNNITKQIQIFGLDGQDHIVVSGSGSGGIKIYCIGGEGADMLSSAENKRYRNILFQDTQLPAKSVSGNSVQYRQVSEDKNVFQRRAYLHDYAVPKLIIAGNPDDGFLFGGGVQWTKQGFQKTPYASMHTLTGFYAVATQAFGLNYAGEWTDVIGKLDVGLTAGFEAPTFVQNFFGFGNDVVELDGEDKDFYRVRKSGYSLIPFIRAGKDQGSSLLVRGGYQVHEVEENAGRFVTTPGSGLSLDVFEEKRFGVVGAAFQYKIVDNPLWIRRGIDFDASAGLDIPVNGDDDAHQYLKTSLAMYYQFKHLGRPTLATRVGMEWHGGDYQFYQGAILGSQENFRGVRKERFVGDRVFYHNTDLRIRISQWRSYFIPASFGIQLNFDHGRVWLDGEDSDTWHYAYGGGFWFSPLQQLLLSINYHKSDIDQRFSVAMGFLF